MSGLIERLRGPCPSIPAMRDAADEIERLTAALRHEADCVEAANVDLWRSGASSRAIARRYGVGKTQVLRIKDGKSWTWHTGSPAGPRG